MELPIRIIVIVFVTLIVGAIMIQFSRNIILDSQAKLHEVGKKEDPLKDKIIELNPGSQTEYANLARACYDMGYGKVVDPNGITCFVVRATTAPNQASIRTAYQGDDYDSTLLTVTVSGGVRTLYFTYEPVGNIIITD